MALRTGPFWLRIAVLCAVFAVLRAFDANVLVAGTIRNFSHALGLHNWERPGPYLLIFAGIAFGAAVLGLLLFRGRTLHPAVRVAAISVVLLVILAVAQSASVYAPVVVLQQMVGPATVSRIIESLLLISLASSAGWFIYDAKRGEAVTVRP